MYQIKPILISGKGMRIAFLDKYVLARQRSSSSVLCSIIAELATGCAHAYTECLQHEFSIQWLYMLSHNVRLSCN